MVNGGVIVFLAAAASIAVGFGFAGVIAIGAIKDTDKVTSGMDSPSSPPSPPFSPPPAPPPPSPPPPSPSPPAARRALKTTHFALRDDERKLLAKSAARLR